ncbi:hypothetical protein EDB19DRAFT_1834172 [Suillus lakei]|nr:hypothetical protein EDB19DRAFT_1834172 [Suillus lakei]
MCLNGIGRGSRAQLIHRKITSQAGLLDVSVSSTPVEPSAILQWHDFKTDKATTSKTYRFRISPSSFFRLKETEVDAVKLTRIFKAGSMVKRGVESSAKHTVNYRTKPIQKPSTFKPKQSSPPKNEAILTPGHGRRDSSLLLGTLEGFPDIFFAKLIKRSGGWPVPSVVPSTDSDGTAWNDEEHTKRWDIRPIMARERACLTTSCACQG